MCKKLSVRTEGEMGSCPLQQSLRHIKDKLMSLARYLNPPVPVIGRKADGIRSKKFEIKNIMYIRKSANYRSYTVRNEYATNNKYYSAKHEIKINLLQQHIYIT